MGRPSKAGVPRTRGEGGREAGLIWIKPARLQALEGLALEGLALENLNDRVVDCL